MDIILFFQMQFQLIRKIKALDDFFSVQKVNITEAGTQCSKISIFRALDYKIRGAVLVTTLIVLNL